MAVRYRNVIRNGNEIEGEKSFNNVTWYKFSASWPLLVIDTAHEMGGQEALERIWDLQDGYGEQGYTPEQGWDWSGIRDSSSAAIEEMLEVAREYVSDKKMEQILGI